MAKTERAPAVHRSRAGASRPARGGTPAGYAVLGAAAFLAASFGLVLGIGRGGRDGSPGVAEPSPPVGVVDSVFPIDEEVRRFRVGLPEVARLSGGARTRDELVDRFIQAVESADTAALVPLLVNRSEFGWLYYPHTIYTAPPYELSPAFLWFQMQNLTDSGLARVYERIEQGPLHTAGYRCEGTPRSEGPNRVWSECRVILHPPGREPVEMQLFGSILERGGTYKFVSYASSL